MRKFKTFAALMPAKLVEAHAQIFNNKGEHCSGDNVEFSRFGYAVRWCDGSGMAGFSADETIETAIEDAKTYLSKNGWTLGPIEYTGFEITPEIIDKFTTEVKSDDETLAGLVNFMKLKMECIKQPWFEMVRSRMQSCIGVYNIKFLPDNVRSNDYEILNCNGNGEILVMTGYGIDDEGYLCGGNAEWTPIDEVRKKFGLPEDSADIDVVNAVVDAIVYMYNHRSDAIRERKEKFLAKFRMICGIFEKVVKSCAEGKCQEVLPDIARLQAYVTRFDWDKGYVFRRLNKRTSSGVIDDLSRDFLLFDWSTCTIEKDTSMHGVVHGKVKLYDTVYSAVRDMYKKEYPKTVERTDESYKKHDLQLFGNWRNTTMDAQWFHFKYGIDALGDAVFGAAYGPETIKSSPSDWTPPETYGDAEDEFDVADES